MSGNIDFPQLPSYASQSKSDKMTSVRPKEKPPILPRPRKLPSLSSSEIEGSEGPEKFPRTLKLDLQPEDKGSDLARFVCEEVLPQRIRITQSFVVPGCSTAINTGDVFLLHFIYENPTVHAINHKGKNVRLPIFAKQKYEILPLDSRLDDVFYSGTKALMDADPLPAAVRVVEAHCSTRQDEDQEVDDVIDILGFEEDEERGRLLVGTSGSSPIKYSTDLSTSRYTTMLSPDFHPMTDLKDRKFPQRVRIPNETKRFGDRNFKEEKVWKLTKYSDDKSIVATREGDNHIYSIPVSAPIKFSHDPLSVNERQILAMLPALYPLVNTTWGLVDPTQEALKTSMEAIPQPFEQVVQEWFQSEEGKSRACEVTKHRVDNLKEELSCTLTEMRQLKSALDFFKNPKSPLTSTEPIPLLPPRPPRSPRKARKPHDLEHAPVVPARPPPPSPDSPTPVGISVEDNSYQSVDEAMTIDKTSSVMKEVHHILAKKERELAEKTRQIDSWKAQYEIVKQENKSLKEKISVPAVYEELPDFPAQISSSPGMKLGEELAYLEPTFLNISYRPRSLKEYTVAQVGDFLRQHDLGKYVEVFRLNGVDGALLVALDETHLIELSMSRLHALKLKIAISKLDLPPLPIGT